MNSYRIEFWEAGLDDTLILMIPSGGSEITYLNGAGYSCLLVKRGEWVTGKRLPKCLEATIVFGPRGIYTWYLGKPKKLSGRAEKFVYIGRGLGSQQECHMWKRLKPLYM